MKLSEINQGDTFKTEDGKILLASDPWDQGERLAIGLGGNTPMGSAHG